MSQTTSTMEAMRPKCANLPLKAADSTAIRAPVDSKMENTGLSSPWAPVSRAMTEKNC